MIYRVLMNSGTEPELLVSLRAGRHITARQRKATLASKAAVPYLFMTIQLPRIGHSRYPLSAATARLFRRAARPAGGGAAESYGRECPFCRRANPRGLQPALPSVALRR